MKFAGSLALVANMAFAATFSELGGFGGFGDDAGFSSGFDMESYFNNSDFKADDSKGSDKPQSSSWSDSIGDSIISENIKKGTDGTTVTTQKVCKPGDEDSMHCRMIQVTNLGQGDADLLMNNDDDKNMSGLKLIENTSAMENNGEQNSNLLAGLLANLGNITGLEGDDKQQKAADGQSKIEEIAAKLNIVDDSIKATVSMSKEANPEQYGIEDSQVEDII